MNKILEELIERYPRLEANKPAIEEAFKILSECYKNGGKLLIAGNGGSSADADHIVGELMKECCLKRPITDDLSDSLKACDSEMGAELAGKLQRSLPAISLGNHNGLTTAVINDMEGNMCFAQQVMGYGVAGDVFWGISTSGNSKNVIYAAITAKAKGMKVIGLTGKGGGRLKDYADVVIDVDETETYKVQELHMPVYHCLCIMLEHEFFQD